ncbi:MAG: hypothetical protein WAL04_04035 [Acidimicrobiales bacterium]|jgi:hypothetical protein
MPSLRQRPPLDPPSAKPDEDPDEDRQPLGIRLRRAIMKPVESDAVPNAAVAHEAPAVEQLEAAVRSANDKERLIGLLAAPLAAAIGFLVISALIVNDPATLLKSGQINKLHVAVSVYYELGGVLLALSVLILATAMLRKRLLLGIVMALYGLAVFNLHYWGFGIPFIMGGAWLLVRSYRLQRDLREATAGGALGGATSRTSVTRAANKRYTPPQRSFSAQAEFRRGQRQRQGRSAG